MNKTIIFVLSAILFGVVISPVLLNSTEPEIPSAQMENYIKEITSNTKIIDVNYNHNQALDVAEYSVNKGIKIPPVLINFDTHSDVYLNYEVLKSSALISNWINEYFAKNSDAVELYWVMPKEEAQKLNLRFFFAENDYKQINHGVPLYGNSLQKLSSFTFLKTPLTKKSYEQEFFIDTETGVMMEVMPDEIYKKYNINFDSQNSKLKKIKITTCTEKTLPDFKDREVFLSIDADYISNSGFDTTDNFINNRNKKQVDTAIYSMVKTIHDKNIRPSIVDLTFSAEYLPSEDHTQLIMFFDKFVKVSKKRDIVMDYKRKIDDYTKEKYKEFNKNQLLYFLKYI